MTDVGYWIFNYTPKWEAASKEVEVLSGEMAKSRTTRLITLNTNSARLRLFGNPAHIPLPHGLVFVPFFSEYLARSYRVNHIFASPGERLLTPRLANLNSLITITKDTGSLRAVEKNAEHLRKFKFVVVESERHREMMRQLGIDDRAIKLIYPGVVPRPYKASSDPFKILFATSPPSGAGLLTRGIHLLLNAAKRCPDVEFVLVWREANIDSLGKSIKHLDLENVRVINGFVPDMGKIYDSAHATILPALEYHSLKPSPHSGLMSLAHGKPVLVSRPTSLARVVEQSGCGVVFEPDVESLIAAIDRLRAGYGEIQANCHATAEGFFSGEVFMQKYRALYEAMLP